MGGSVYCRALIDWHWVSFGAAQWLIFIALFNARGAAFSYRELIDVAFKDDPDGGPCDISTSLHHLRRKLLPTRFRVPTNLPGLYQAVRLVRLPAVAHTAAALTDAGCGDRPD